ncbi:MAG: glycerophosphodiester phosphodiesterase [Sedimentisphaerales bacterium]|nr:glycerophosphodiester phosphodiesterase [Sedimentisphaerales bacterium]
MTKRFWLAVLLGIIVAGCRMDSKAEIIAHRGASYLAPENTRASTLLAWKLNADAVEVDVYLSKDNRIVVIHDRTTKRTAGVDVNVAQATAEELRQLDVGSFKSKKYAGEKIPFLEEIIATIPPKKKLYVEVKCGPEIVPLLKQVIEQSGKKKQIVIISFNLDVVAQAKKVMPNIPAYWLLGTQKDKQTEALLPHDPQWLQTASQRGIEGLDVHYAGVTPDFMKAVKEHKQELYVWTVDDPKEAKRLIALGVKGITTNRPAWLRKQLK